MVEFAGFYQVAIFCACALDAGLEVGFRGWCGRRQAKRYLIGLGCGKALMLLLYPLLHMVGDQCVRLGDFMLERMLAGSDAIGL